MSELLAGQITFGGWLAVAIAWVLFRKPGVPLFSVVKLWRPQDYLTPVGVAIFSAGLVAFLVGAVAGMLALPQTGRHTY
jgi:hypothetical protein